MGINDAVGMCFAVSNDGLIIGLKDRKQNSVRPDGPSDCGAGDLKQGVFQ